MLICGLEQQSQKVSRSVAAFTRCETAALFDDGVNGSTEKPQRRAFRKPGWSRQEGRKTKRVQGIDAPQRVEIDSHGITKLLRVAPQTLRKDRALQNIERQTRHLLSDIDDA